MKQVFISLQVVFFAFTSSFALRAVGSPSDAVGSIPATPSFNEAAAENLLQHYERALVNFATSQGTLRDAQLLTYEIGTLYQSDFRKARINEILNSIYSNRIPDEEKMSLLFKLALDDYRTLRALQIKKLKETNINAPDVLNRKLAAIVSHLRNLTKYALDYKVGAVVLLKTLALAVSSVGVGTAGLIGVVFGVAVCVPTLGGGCMLAVAAGLAAAPVAVGLGGAALVQGLMLINGNAAEYENLRPINRAFNELAQELAGPEVKSAPRIKVRIP